MQHLVMLSLFIIVVIITGCGWHFQRKIMPTIPNEMKIMIFNSKISNNLLNFAICDHLRLNGIKLIENSSYQNISSLCIESFSLDKNAVSIFQDGYTAEYQMILTVDILISIPNTGIYPIKIKIYHAFFNNPYTALIKDIEQQIIINEMYNKAAEELIRKLQNLKITKIPVSIKTSHIYLY